MGEAERRAMENLELNSFPGARNCVPEAPTNKHKEYWQRKVVRPGYKDLKKDVQKLGYVGTGKKYGVSNNAVKKWMKQYEKGFEGTRQSPSQA